MPRKELIYPELSYKLVGLAYKIDNSIGFGQSEKVYCDALEELLKQSKIRYEREIYSPIKIEEKVIAKRYFDFLIEGKIIIEVKAGVYRYREVCDQLFGYLKAGKLLLGIVIRFTRNGVQVKRIPCYY
ncbi:MAG TPA: GxxExxY protein [bacterium]|nr:GxxExxY protein [bacterium]